MPGYYTVEDRSWSQQEARTADYLNWIAAAERRAEAALSIPAQVVPQRRVLKTITMKQKIRNLIADL